MNENKPRAGRTGRRRENVRGGRQHRHEVKVSPEEEAMLLRLAGEQRVSVPRLLVEAALSGGSGAASERRRLLEELFAVHRLLGSVANNVNQIAKVTNATREEQPETAAVLDAVRRAAARVDAAVDGLSI